MTELKRCEARIWHGPGHQSQTKCYMKGWHTVHRATYGRYDQYAEWRAEEVFSGYFDEAPQEEDD